MARNAFLRQRNSFRSRCILKEGTGLYKVTEELDEVCSKLPNTSFLNLSLLAYLPDFALVANSKSAQLMKSVGEV